MVDYPKEVFSILDFTGYREWIYGSFGRRADLRGIINNNEFLKKRTKNTKKWVDIIQERSYIEGVTARFSFSYKSNTGLNSAVILEGLLKKAQYLLDIFKKYTLKIENNIIIIEDVALEIRSDNEKQIIINDCWLVGASRKASGGAHTEKNTLAHINEIFVNIDALPGLEQGMKNKLRIIALVHDTFKYLINQKADKTKENHHGYKAAEYLKKYCNEKDVLFVVRHHDDFYNIYNRYNRAKETEKKNILMDEAVAFLNQIYSLGAIDLYSLFFYVDSNTGAKSLESYYWYLSLIEKYKI